MKIQIVLFCIFSTFATFLKSAEINVSVTKTSPEGSYKSYDDSISTAIVFIADRNGVYKSLRTGEERIVVSNTDGPIAMTENANCVVDKKNVNFRFTALPSGEVTYATFGKAKLAKDRTIERGQISNLCVAPNDGPINDGQLFYYEKDIYDSDTRDSCHVIVPKMKEFEAEGLAYQAEKAERKKSGYQLSRSYGNTAGYTQFDFSINANMPVGNLLALPPQEALARFGVKRNAYCLALPKPERWKEVLADKNNKWREGDEKLCAYALQTGPQVTTIQLIDNSAMKYSHSYSVLHHITGEDELDIDQDSVRFFKGRKNEACWYEINKYFSAFNGLAFSDKGLTHWDGDTVYLISFEELEKWMKNSGTVKSNNPVMLFPVNYVLNPEVTVAIKGVIGTKPYWDGENFFFVNPKGALCVWQNGFTRVLLEQAPDEFCYCRDRLAPLEKFPLFVKNKGTKNQNAKNVSAQKSIPNKKEAGTKPAPNKLTGITASIK